MTDKPYQNAYVRNGPLPIKDSDNGSDIRSFEFELTDSSLLIRAFSTAISVIMMGGAEESIGRLKYYQNQLKAICPPGAELFKDDFALTEIAILSNTVPTWTIFRVYGRRWNSDYRVVVKIGDRKYPSEDRYSGDEYDVMATAVRTVVSLTCEEVHTEDLRDANPWDY